MKINAQEQSIEASGLGQTSNFGIKNSAAAFQLLSSGLYTNKIRAVLREIGCNAVDAHALNGQQATPIEVKLPNRLDNQFYIRDFGPGLSHDQIMHLYSTYFDSTKQASDDFIGGFGVGSKSPFAYTDSFTVVSRQNGMERVYAAFVNDEGMPTIATMSEATPTTEANGLMVGFPVRPEDFYTFESEAEEVYSAFKVKPNVLGVVMQWSDLAAKPVVEGVAVLPGGNRRGELQLNMGGVRYPLNAFAEKLRQTSVELTPMAQWLYQQNVEVDVPIGAVSVAASREALQYDKKTMANIPGIIDAAAQRCLVELQTALHSVPKDISPVDRAKQLSSLLEAKGTLSWRRLPAKTMSALFQDPTDLMVCQMALTEQYTIDLTKYPALHVWRMQSQVHEKLHEHGVKGNKVNDFEGRKKMLASLRRNWGSLTANDSALNLLLSHSSHSLRTFASGPAKALRDDQQIELSLEKKLPVFETTNPMTLESLLANHQAQPSAEYYERHSKKYIVSPVHQFVDGKSVPLTALQRQEFETQKAAFYAQYGIVAEPLATLPSVTAPPKVKAVPAVWTVPLNVRVHNDLKRTLRGIPSSEVGVAHTVANKEAIPYVVYDRKASQERLQIGSLHSTDLIVQAAKFSNYLEHSTELSKRKVPINQTQLVDKKDLPAFKALYPQALPLSDYINNLKNDPVFLAEAEAWSKTRPKLIHVDHSAQQWADLAEKMKNLSPQSDLAIMTKKWATYATSGNDKYGEDSRTRAFYNCILSTQYPENALLNTNDDVKKLNTVYPYIRYFNYSTPEELKAEYIADVNAKNGWGPEAAPDEKPSTPNPY